MKHIEESPFVNRLFTITAAILVFCLAGTAQPAADQVRRYISKTITEENFGDNILLEGNPPQIEHFEKWLDQIAEVPKGYQTLKTISESGHELTIRHSKHVFLSAGRTLAPMSSNLINGKGESVTILFSAHIQDSGSHMVYNAQRKLIEYTAIQNLYHELAHAMHMMKGSWRYFSSEKQAIEEENIFRRDLAGMQGTPVTERWRKNGVLISNVDGIVVMSEWFGPSIIKMPDPLYPAENVHQVASGAELGDLTWHKPER